MSIERPLSRRSFLTAATASAAALGVGGIVPSASGAEDSRSQGHVSRNSFPKGFWWGTATAAYQIEGAAGEDGRAPSIWDTFSLQPGKTENGDTGDVSCDFYHRFAGDVKLMSELGVKHFRFSISWSRIMPSGRGPVNGKGMDFYRRLADTLLEHGITPHATLYHWDLPQSLQGLYSGWQNREVVNDFGAYASAVAEGLGDRVRHWMTLNEISTFVRLGYGVGHPGIHAPGLELKTDKELNQIIHHALLAHGTACLAIRAACHGKCHVAIAENYDSFVPAIVTPENVDAARRAFVRESPNGCILMPVLTGKYNEGWLEDNRDKAPDISDGDMKLIAQPLDGLGFNCYTGSYVRAADNPKGYEVLPFFEGYPKANMPWLNIVPESIYWGIRMVGEAAGQKKLPIFISENGCADGGRPEADGRMLDTDRVMYYRSYLGQLKRSIDEGCPAAGFFPWSLLDNFEWACGYSKRFGLVRVNFQTQERTPKLSFEWYKQVIRENQIV